MKENIFTPKYNFWLLILIYALLVAVGIGLVLFGIALHNLFLRVIGFVMVPFSLISLISSNPRLVIFRENNIVVNRVLFPDLVLDYALFSGIDKEFVRFGDKVISLTFLSNSDELHIIFSKLFKDGKIAYPPLRLFDWWLAFKAFRVSFPVAFILTGFSIIVLDLSNLLSIYVVNCALFLVLFSIFYLLIRNEENTRRKENTLRIAQLGQS